MSKKLLLSALLVACSATAWASEPVKQLLERIAPGASSRIELKQVDSPTHFFEISSVDGKPLITADNPVNLAFGLHWYLKYYTGNHYSWDNLKANLPEVLPVPEKAERHERENDEFYYLNYCTHSYSMAFWDWDRWEKEIDWMALHGINMPLAMTGMDVVWRNTLRRLGYNKEEIDRFIAGPAFQAWWLMNNLEGWGGPMSDEWYADREALQKRILARMDSLGMKPVLPGYSGMVPHDADTRLGLNISGKGMWNGFVRPAFLMANDPRFNEIADIYYDELTKTYGTAPYYSMDPFHEGGSTEGVDLTEAGTIIYNAMKRANPEARWVVQGWQLNPRQAMLDGVPVGEIITLDLASEVRPQWGDPNSPSTTPRPEGYGPHHWYYCMLLNFGGNVGLHGRMETIIDGYFKALESPFGATLKGLGLTMEGIENNAVMYELLSELPWESGRFTKEDWIKRYITARYGAFDQNAYDGWLELGNTIYNAPLGNLQQGCSESVFCGRPSMNLNNVSSWSKMKKYYEPQDVIDAAMKFSKSARHLGANEAYQYDLVDITRQAVAEKGRLTYHAMVDAINRKDEAAFDSLSNYFLTLIDLQDNLLSTMPDFMAGRWINDARRLAPTEAERDNFEWNARLLVTTWGERHASEKGKLRDYAHREWNGMLKDFYRPRWEAWIAQQKDVMNGKDVDPIDFYALDEQWVRRLNPYPETAQGDPVATSLVTLERLKTMNTAPVEAPESAPIDYSDWTE